MHYRNGREAVNGDKIVSFNGMPGEAMAVGVLRDATPGNDYCNGFIQQGFEPSGSDPIACMCDCLHVDDLAVILAEKGLDKRPDGM
jgi:hypothetical protein